MKIVVLVKEVPDTFGSRTLSLETGLAERDASENVIDEISERALEVALSYAEANEGTEVSVLTVAPSTATASIRKALAMGAAAATHVVDDGLIGADLGLTAEVIAAALSKVGFDLVIAGNQSTDGMGGVLPSMIAELLSVPAATSVSEVTISENEIRATRSTDDAKTQVVTAVPAVISVTEALPDPRFPNFKGIMAAKKKPLEVLSLADLGIHAEDMSASRAIMIDISKRPPREAGITITDEGDAAVQLAAFLSQQHLI